MSTPTHDLSARGAALAATPSLPTYLLEHFPRLDDAYDADTNPSGYIPLCIAENRLVWDLIAPMVHAPRDVPPGALGYADMTGPLPFRAHLAAFLGERVLQRPVHPDHLAVLGGAGSVLETLFYALGDPGDGVLVPTPSYAGFWMDLELRDALRIVPVHTRADDGFRLTPELLDAAVDTARVPVRALLYTTPNNPLGTVATAEELEAVVAWAEGRGIHVVVDEVYALSVYGERPFVSVAQLRPQLGEHLHIVWAFSKDMAASGLRCGVLITENEGVRAAVNGLAYWAACSGDTLHLLQRWITDDDWLDRYLPAMQDRLRTSARRVVSRLGAAGIAVTGGEAGFFVLVDLRPHLEAATWEAEDALWRRLLAVGINLTPGAAIRSVEPGLFRLCFASVDLPTLDVALDRLVAALG